MAKSLENNLAEGKVFNKLIGFALPIFLANVLQMFYSLVDTLVVGRIVGSVGISAVTIGSQLSQIFVCVGMGLANGGPVIIAQLKGAGDRDGMKSIIGTLLSVSAIVGIVVGAVGIAITGPTLRLMNTAGGMGPGGGLHGDILCRPDIRVYVQRDKLRYAWPWRLHASTDICRHRVAYKRCPRHKSCRPTEHGRRGCRACYDNCTGPVGTVWI